MSIHIIRRDELTSDGLASLQRELLEYYSNPPDSYYQIANKAADTYRPDLMPFHCDLTTRVTPGMNVLELGCGSAHLCPHVESAGGRYIGMDFSADLLASNTERFPQSRFYQAEAELIEEFDLVASLYTIEHVVDPPGYLERMWGFCKPGGLLAVICPEFIDCDSFPPCFYFGASPRRFREKLLSMALLDAFRHGLDLLWNAPRWKARARSAPPGAFWINTRPSELNGQVHGIDTDAVHLPRRRDIEWWFQQRGAEIVATSNTLPGVPAEVLQYNCYVLAEKPVNLGSNSHLQ